MNKSTNLKVAVSTDVCICDVNRNKIDDISVIEKCSSVDDFYDNYGEYVRYGCNRERFHYAVGYLERSIEHGVWMIIDKELHDLYSGHVISTNCSIQIGDKLQTDRLGSVLVDITTNIDVEVDCPDSTKKLIYICCAMN